MMDISKEALKSLKSRTLSDLRRLLPISADELGIDFEQVLSPTPEVLGVRTFLPSEENGGRQCLERPPRPVLGLKAEYRQAHDVILRIWPSELSVSPPRKEVQPLQSNR